MSYPEIKNYKYPPEIRAAMRISQKAYRERKKMEAAKLGGVSASTVNTTTQASEPMKEALQY